MAVMDLGAINYVAVGVCVVLLMVLGFAWYAPFLFGRTWMTAIGKTEEEVRAAGSSRALTVALVDATFTTIALAIVFQSTGIEGIGIGIVAAVGLSIGLAGVSIISAGVYERRPRTLVLINLGYRLIGYTIVGIILTVW